MLPLKTSPMLKDTEEDEDHYYVTLFDEQLEESVWW